MQGVGWILGSLAALAGGTQLQCAERVVAQGNTFGRGPLLYYFPQPALDALLADAEAGDKGAVLLTNALLRHVWVLLGRGWGRPHARPRPAQRSAAAHA